MPLTLKQIQSTFGDFNWHDDAKLRGGIIIDGDWYGHNITRIEPPCVLLNSAGKPIKQIACHSLIADQLSAALFELRDAGLSHLINTWDGCFVPRHMCWDPARALSHHCWGIAFDINARSFPMGSKAKQDGRLIACFGRHGFEWGGSWKTPDPMHFEFCRAGSPSPATPGSAGVSPAPSSNSSPLRILINDQVVTEGIFIDGVAYAPVRLIADALGAATLAYRPEQGKIYIYTKRV